MVVMAVLEGGERLVEVVPRPLIAALEDVPFFHPSKGTARDEGLPLRGIGERLRWTS